MFALHQFLANIGFETETYKTEVFKSEHPQYLVIDTCLQDALGEDESVPQLFRMAKITGKGVYFARSKHKVYVAAGKADMRIRVDRYGIRLVRRRGKSNWVLEQSMRYRAASIGSVFIGAKKIWNWCMRREVHTKSMRFRKNAGSVKNTCCHTSNKCFFVQSVVVCKRVVSK